MISSENQIVFLNILVASLLIGITILFFSCYRDEPSSYNIGKVQSINLLSPQGGERFIPNQDINVQWLSLNIDSRLRIELIDSLTEIYQINNIPDSGSFAFNVPVSISPSKNYRLRIESMAHPEVFDFNKNYFEIVPDIQGHWVYSNILNGVGLEISLDLSAYVGDSFLGDGTFYFKYRLAGELYGYESYVTAGGILSYPQIGFKLRGQDNKEFDITGRMINNYEIKGNIKGVIDGAYGSINDSLVLTRQ